ncbi:MAG: hypothetical protein IJW49_11825 [Clostridia bacterium]|nr:hypothetical protein [Clostridia bacterium]MBQ9807177.1 hypothetical protein [Clostridia bacterium]
MIKGSRRQMIVIRTDKSRYFDEAYFVLRKNLKSPAHSDILTEANRILAERIAETKKPTRHSLLRWLFFGVGVLCGALVTVAVCLALL